MNTIFRDDLPPGEPHRLDPDGTAIINNHRNLMLIPVEVLLPPLLELTRLLREQKITL